MLRIWHSLFAPPLDSLLPNTLCTGGKLPAVGLKLSPDPEATVEKENGADAAPLAPEYRHQSNPKPST